MCTSACMCVWKASDWCWLSSSVVLHFLFSDRVSLWTQDSLIFLKRPTSLRASPWLRPPTLGSSAAAWFFTQVLGICTQVLLTLLNAEPFLQSLYFISWDRLFHKTCSVFWLGRRAPITACLFPPELGLPPCAAMPGFFLCVLRTRHSKPLTEPSSHTHA